MEPNDSLDIQPEQETPQIAKKEFDVTLIVLIVLLLTVIFVSIFYFIFLNKSHKNQTEEVLQQNTSEITKDTIIAKSLNVPALFPNVQWKDVTDATHDAITNSLLYSNGSSSIALKGHYWYAQTTDESSNGLENYYQEELGKNGWFAKGGTGSLQFKNFSLSPPAADGPCGGIDGYLGYKNGFIRLVTVTEQTDPCKSPVDKSVDTSTDTTVFISDPTSIQDIVSDIKKH